MLSAAQEEKLASTLNFVIDFWRKDFYKHQAEIAALKALAANSAEDA